MRRGKSTFAACLLTALFSACFFSGCLFSGDGKHAADPSAEYYSTSTEGLPAADTTSTVNMRDGDTLRLKVEFVKQRIAGRWVRMMGYNRSVPGPTIKAPQGSQIHLVLSNLTDIPVTMHSHGVRLDYAMDGTAGFSQKAILQGDSFTYAIRFPDPGIFWYHSHFREDYSQEMGLYGNFLVTPSDSGYYHPVDREAVLMLDDIQIDGTGPETFLKKEVDHTLMGRFGNTLLINGDTGYTLTIKRNEVVRFYATNSANARTFQIGFDRNMLKVIGGDNGLYETPVFSALELIAVGERSIFEAYFNDTGMVDIIHSFPGQTMVIGHIHVLPDSAVTGYYRTWFNPADSSPAAIRSIDPFRPFFDKEPDKELILTGTMGGGAMMNMAMKTAAVAARAASAAKATPTAKVTASAHIPGDVNNMGVEWYDHMPEANSASTTETVRWIMRDKRTGEENHNIFWSFKTGDKVMIRIYNDSLAMHPMAHPIHFHGQRFLVLNVNGSRVPDLAWKDTFLIGKGYTVDILLDASNPGGWMAHCHISEHMEDMMMLYYHVGD